MILDGLKYDQTGFYFSVGVVFLETWIVFFLNHIFLKIIFLGRILERPLKINGNL